MGRLRHTLTALMALALWLANETALAQGRGIAIENANYQEIRLAHSY